MLKIATLIATLIAASAFVSHAEAHGGGGFYTSKFYRDQGRKPAQPHCGNENRLEAALARARARRLAELRAQRSAAVAAAKRARFAAIKRQEAAKAAALKQAAVSSQTASTETVAKKGDLLPVASTAATPTRTAANDQADVTTKTASVASPEICRAYSPAADGLIEVPCK